MIVRQCQVHHHRSYVPLDDHHLHPLGEGGPDEPHNIIVVCPNAHRRIHDYLRLLKKNKGKAPWAKAMFFGHMVRYYGQLGYELMEMARATEEEDPA